MAQITLIVGLGNPGTGHAGTRHNAGYWFLKELARRYPLDFRLESRFKGELAELRIGGRKLQLLRPNTFMNLSGASVAPFARYFDVAAEQILVVHDDLDLPPGVARIKNGGGHGGHNGLRGLFSDLGSRDFMRLRLGIGHPGNSDEVTDYVLRIPSAQDRELILEAVQRSAGLLEDMAAGDWERVMNELHKGPNRKDD
jgi:PTH1 family peptidyl-tRNA hydrolase